jgi:DNA invertase Pin-like site-specific DNA recombinase
MVKSVGYARVSTTHQATDTQVSALKDAGCSNVFYEVISSRTPVDQRHQLLACLAVLEPEDELVVTKLDRLGRTQVEVINRLHDLQVQGIHVRTLDGLISTQALGKMAPLVIGLLTGLAEVERELTRERTRESVEHRKRTGGNLGGRPSLPKVKKDHILRLRQEGNSIRSIAELTGVSASAVHKFCKEAGI